MSEQQPPAATPLRSAFFDEPREAALPVFSIPVQHYLCSLNGEHVTEADPQAASRIFSAILTGAMADRGYSRTDESVPADLWPLTKSDDLLKLALNLVQYQVDSYSLSPQIAPEAEADEVAALLAAPLGFSYTLDAPEEEAGHTEGMQLRHRIRLQQLSQEQVAYHDFLPEDSAEALHESADELSFGGESHPNKNITNGQEEDTFLSILMPSLFHLGYRLTESPDTGSAADPDDPDDLQPDHVEPPFQRLFDDNILMDRLFDFVADYYRNERTITTGLPTPFSTHADALHRAAAVLELDKQRPLELLRSGQNVIDSGTAEIFRLQPKPQGPAKG
jgi:hypothetical protein